MTEMTLAHRFEAGDALLTTAGHIVVFRRWSDGAGRVVCYSLRDAREMMYLRASLWPLKDQPVEDGEMALLAAYRMEAQP